MHKRERGSDEHSGGGGSDGTPCGTAAQRGTHLPAAGHAVACGSAADSGSGYEPGPGCPSCPAGCSYWRRWARGRGRCADPEPVLARPGLPSGTHTARSVYDRCVVLAWASIDTRHATATTTGDLNWLRASWARLQEGCTACLLLLACEESAAQSGSCPACSATERTQACEAQRAVLTRAPHRACPASCMPDTVSCTVAS